MTIVEGLLAEHRVFLTLFDQLEHALPKIKTVDEMRLLCRILEGLLHNHGEAEDDLSCVAVDHVLKEHKRHLRFHHDHQEIDGHLKEVARIEDLHEARRRLTVFLEACRAHFRDEEQNLFPLVETAIRHETLLALGRAWRSQSSGVRLRWLS